MTGLGIVTTLKSRQHLSFFKYNEVSILVKYVFSKKDPPQVFGSSATPLRWGLCPLSVEPIGFLYYSGFKKKPPPVIAGVTSQPLEMIVGVSSPQLLNTIIF